MKLRLKNHKMLAILVTAIFFFSLFPGYGFAEESPELANVPVVNTASEPGMSQDVITGGGTDETPGEGSGETPGGGTDETPGDGSGETPGGGTDETLGDGSGETTGGEADGIPDDNNNGTNEQENTGDDPQGNSGDNPDGTPGEDPQGNPGENPEGTPGDELDEQLDENIVQQPMPVIPEKVTLTINHVLDLGDGNDKPAYTETIEGLDAGATVRGSDYQVREEGIVFVGSQPEELVLGSGENLITLLYSPQKEMPENPDYLNGPQAISAPEIYYPMAPMASKMMKGFNVMGVLGSGVDENGNITDSNTPGYISLNKEANKIADNQWQITLTISGVPKTETTDIVLVIDRSGSMSGSKLSAAKEAARNFVNRLLPDGNTTTRIALVSFAGNVTTHNSSNPFRTALEKQNLLNDINSLSASGGTFTQAGLRQAEILLAGSNADNKVIVLLSDGVPTYSYSINNPDSWLVYWKEDDYRTSDAVSKNAYDYGNVVGDGTESETCYRYRLFGNDYYYSHGNSAISQSKFAKDAGQTIYTIALEAGTEGNRVLNGIASPGKAYTASPADLNTIFSSIASSIAPAATNATITDPMGQYFSIPGINASNYKSLITVSEGTIEYNTGTETIRWHLDAISTGPYTMSYIVEIDPGAPSGTHDTNGDTPINYTNINGNPAEKPFPIPVVEITGAEVDLIYHPNGGEGTMNPRTEPIGSKFNLDANAFTRTGHTFQGWSTRQDGGVDYADQAEFTMPAGGATLYAVWQANTNTAYTVEHYKQDLGAATYTLAESESLTGTTGAQTAAVAKVYPGFTAKPFSQETIAGDGSTVVKIYYDRNNYTITYKVTGEYFADDNFAQETYKYGETVTPLDTDMSKEGYTFSGWSTIPTTMPAQDVVVTGSYSINSYTITYKVTGDYFADDNFAQETYKYGEAVTPLGTDMTQAGYTFSGWSTIPTTMPAQDVVVTGSYSINSYTITYKVVGDYFANDKFAEETYEYGETVTPLGTDMTQAGYTFSGWSTIPETMPAQDVVVTGSYSINSYKITYKVVGDYFADDNFAQETYKYGETVTPLATNMSKEGYTFSGWSTIPETMPAQDVVVTGSYSINSYTITYKVTGDYFADDNFAQETYEYGEAVTPLGTDMTQAGYTFSGWSTIPETMPAQDVVVTGSYSINSYTITYKVVGDYFANDNFAEETYEYGEAVTPLGTDMTQAGYTFSGWSTIPETMPAQDVVVTGSYSINSYKITYKVVGDYFANDKFAEETYEYGETVTPLGTDMTQAGYTFSGWSTIPETMPAQDVVVTGSYSINSYTITYKVTGDYFADDNFAQETYEYGEAVTPLGTDMTQAGYTFSGWSTIPETMPAQDVVVTGSYSINSYTITYKVVGDYFANDKFAEETYEYGEAVTPLGTDMTQAGYTFSGWSTIPETMPAQDVVVTGSYSINSYKITYKVVGDYFANDKFAQETYEYGETVTPLGTDMTQAGYTFSGWSTIPTTMPAQDVVVTGSYSINSYTITYKVTGEYFANDKFAEQTYKYGETVTPLDTDMSKEGYTFSGWSTIPTTMPAQDVVVTGSYSINSYKITYKVVGDYFADDNFAQETYEYGETVTPLGTDMTQAGYTFSGWSTIPETMPAQDVVVTGSYSINSYTITYKVVGDYFADDKFAEETYEYGEAVTPLATDMTQAGYTFSGWSTIPETMPAQDVVVTGSYSINSYTITYKVVGDYFANDKFAEETYEYGETVTPLGTDMTQAGYTFSGWSTIPETMPAQDVVVTGSYSINSYTITYKVTGDYFADDNFAQETYEYGEAVTPLGTDMTQAGYTFSGWSTIPETMPAQDVVVTGSYSINSYTITYKVTGDYFADDNFAQETYEYGEAVTPLGTDMTQAGYTFSGWSTIPETMPAQDVVVTGSYSINSYTITYKVVGDYFANDKFAEETYEYGEAVTPLGTDMTQAGYTFSGWSTIPETMPAQDVVVTGSYSINSYTITYKVVGDYFADDNFAEETYEYGEAVTPLGTDMTQAGYTFSGWSTIPETMPAQDVVVTGSYSINSYTITYKVVGDYFADDNFAEETYEYGEAVTPLGTDMTQAGYTFSGWSTIPETMPAQDVVVTGSYSINSYTITYKVVGDYFADDNFAQETYEYGEAVTPLGTDMTQAGYTFSGWSTIPETMPAQDVVVTGSYSINSYTITYKVVGDYFADDNFAEETYEYGEAVTPLGTDMTQAGYTFSGWSTIPETMPAQDVVVTGSYSINSYTITYKVVGDYFANDKFAEETYEYGEAVTPLGTDMTQAGYTFSGWSTIPETMPAQDVVVTGSYSINSYTITYKVVGDYFADDNFAQETYEYGEAVTPLGTDMTQAGYTFSGWSTIPETMPAQDVVVTGSYSINSYTITYKVVGDYFANDKFAEETYEYGEAVTPLGTDMTQAGYTFSGWSTIPETMPAQDVVVTGSYSINSYTITYKVVGDYFADDNFAQETYEYGEAVTPLGTDMTQAGYTFSGWSTIPETMPAQDVVVTGSYSINSYKITYKVVGDYFANDKFAEETYEYGEAVTPLGTDMTQAGYTFSGWSTIPETMPAQDVVVTGSYSRRSGGGGGGGGGSTEQEIVVEPEATLVPLNKEDHFAYIAGYPDNTVKPEGNVTREEVAAVFYRLLDETYRESVKTDVNNFSDVEAGRWSNTQISTLASIGVITGYPDGTFRPSNSITRAELATIASKFDNLSPFEADSFSDIAGHWANQYINSAAQKGWIKGYEDGTFRPQQAITRAEFVTLVNNVLGRKVLKENILPEAKTFPDLSTNAWYYEAMMEAINGHYYERENPDDYEVWTELYESHIDL